MHQGLFLDRDGTINEEIDFLSSPHQLRLLPGSAEAIREANSLGFKVCIVTNQSGIARGLLTEDELAGVHRELVSLLARENATIDGIYYCPHHPDYGEPRYRKTCDCRKPGTGMLEQASRELDIDLKRSIVVGDRLIDLEMGNNSGAVSILVQTGYGKTEAGQLSRSRVRADYVAENLLDAVRHVARSTGTPQDSKS